MKDLQDQIRSATTHIESILRKHCPNCPRAKTPELIRNQLFKIEWALKEYAERASHVAYSTTHFKGR